MKKLKILFFIAFMYMLLFIALPTYAANANITANATNVNVGDIAKVTVTINAAAWNIKVSGNATDTIVGYNADAENQKVTKTYSINTSKVGTYSVAISGDVTDASSDTPNKINYKNVSITVNEKVASSTTSNEKENTNKSNTTTKKATTIAPKAESKKEEVKKEEETKKTEVETQYLLESLDISGISIDPTFNKEIFEYTVNIKDKNFGKLDIIAKADNDESIIDIKGNENLQLGENIITIELKGQEDKAPTIYTIKVLKEKSELDIANENIEKLSTINKVLFVIIGLLALAIIILLVMLILKNRKDKEEV